jgi:protein-L-isoaspartate(D-aspartate) O-methyltransferase
MPIAEYATARRNMVESQLKPNKVNDTRVIAAMAATPRELFVPAAVRGVAYLDHDVALGQGRYLMEPMVLARLLQAAAIEPNDKVLVIGAGSGYSAAVVARLAGKVVAQESDSGLAARARGTLRDLGCDTVSIVGGKLEAGEPASAPYDVILLDGSVEAVPDALIRQLGEGGRLLAIVRRAGIGNATLLRRLDGGRTAERILFDAATPPLPGFAVPAGFVF